MLSQDLKTIKHIWDILDQHGQRHSQPQGRGASLQTPNEGVLPVEYYDVELCQSALIGKINLLVLLQILLL